MIAFALSMLLLVAQASGTPPTSPAPAAPAAATPAPSSAPPVATAPPAPAAPEKPVPPSARLEGILLGMKGKPKTLYTSKLGPADAIRLAIDGEVLIWSVKLAGETVCGPNAAGTLICAREGDGECMVVVAFSKVDASTIWRQTGIAPACEKAADMLIAPPVAPPKYKSGR